jgi:hypothetical protein
MAHRPELQVLVVHLARVDRLADLRLDLSREARGHQDLLIRPLGKASSVGKRR